MLLPCRFPSRLAVLVLSATVLSVLGLACSKDSSTSPTPPETNTLNIAGSWAGTAADSSGPGQMSWVLTQSGSSFSGTLSMTDGSTGVKGRGTVSGTLSGTSVQFSMTVPSGGFDSPYETCSSTVSGTGVGSSATITGSYTGSASCSGTISSGQINLNKQ